MKHLIPLTTDQLEIIESSLKISNKYSDSEYIRQVDDLLDVIDQNSDYVLWKDKDDIIEKCIEENQP
tara:strand:+ start:61 stop:261 length:201 start_codon:yes stop_codon:yes gene_type:complete